ncbi:hypothetical protein DVH24_011601 [Malus domestica]|uniref:Uncharacterized protein n=1 Tax=Malus domestica TaxID=3750 RepID=A0A498JW13_MALDO|nr:hypothetical protein DVH24_011601 [Malus domestica]
MFRKITHDIRKPLLLENELRVFPSDPDGDNIIRRVTESGFVAVSHGCGRLRYILYSSWNLFIYLFS